MTVTRPKGGTGNCCPDCLEPHKDCGKAGCIPQFICVLIERTNIALSTTIQCGRYGNLRMAHICGTDNYTGGSITIGGVVFTISATIIDNGDSYCFKVIVENAFEEVTYLVCDPPAIALSKQALTIQVAEYPDEDFVGTIEVFPQDGVSNNYQYGTPGECPNCAPIRVNHDTEDPRMPCDAVSLLVSQEAAERNFGSDWQTQLANGDIFSNEFCWFYPPCKCIPTRVCLTYTYTNACNETLTIRKPIDLVDCSYSTTITLCRKGDYGGGCEEETVEITGTINTSCEIVWRFLSDSFDVTYTSDMGRVTLGSAKYTKRCGVGLGPVEIEESAIEGITGVDTVTITDSCECRSASYVDCPSACQGFRPPTLIEIDQTEADRCYRPIISAEIAQCGEISASFEMHYEGFQFTTGEARNPLDDCQFIEIDELDQQGIGPCQRWLSYNNLSLTDPTHPLVTNLGLIPLGECPDVYDPVTPGLNLYYNTGCFELIYPNECDGEVSTANIFNYRLYYQLDLVCETPSSADFVQLTGYVNPDSGDCEQNLLVFKVPFSSVGTCNCNCEELTVTLTVGHVAP